MDKKIGNSRYETDYVAVYIDLSGKCLYHLGVSYIVANLVKNEYKACIYVNDGKQSITEIADAILEKDSEFIGFSVYDTKYFLVKDIAEIISQKTSKKRYIIIGGPTATFSAQKAMQYCACIDFALCYAGEITTQQLIDTVRKRENLNKVPDLFYRNHGHIARSSYTQDCIKDLDIYSSPYLMNIIDVNKCVAINGGISILTSRGCAYHCGYCVHSKISHSHVAMHSIARVVQEIKHVLAQLTQENPVRIDFIDDVFTMSKERTIGLCKCIIESKLNIVFSIQTRADLVDEEILMYLSKAGCTNIAYGLESAVASVLHSMNKLNYASDDCSRERAFLHRFKKIVSLTESFGITVSVYTIIGWYNETYEDGKNTLEFLKQLGIKNFSHSYVTYYKGTVAYDLVLERVKNEVDAIEKKMKWPIFNLNVRGFPQLYNYDLEMLPYSQSDMFVYTHKRKKVYIQAVSGLSVDNNDVYVIHDDPKSLEIFQQMRKTIPLDSKFVFWNTKDIHILWHFAQAPLGFDYFTKTWATLYDNSRSFIQVDLQESSDLVQNQMTISIEQLNTKEKINQFLKELNSSGSQDFLEKYSPLKSNFVLDLCRWVGKCNAGKRLIVTDGEFYPCFCAMQPISEGPFPKEWKLIHKAIEMKQQEITKERNCAYCDINSSCPKCLYIQDIGESAYCELQHVLVKNKKLRLMLYYLLTQFNF